MAADNPTTNGTATNGQAPPLQLDFTPEEDRYIDHLVINEMTSRRDWMRRHMDPRRDIKEECGFPERPLNPQTLLDLYEEDPIAARVVEAITNECFQIHPDVYEDEQSKGEKPFEKDWKALARRLQGARSWYGQTEGSSIWDYFRRADIEARKGRYGVMLLGFSDGVRDLSLPVQGAMEQGDYSGPALTGTAAQYDVIQTYLPSDAEVVDEDSPPPPRKPKKRLTLNYIRVFPEALAQVTQTDTNIGSPRFGQPVMYQITVADPRLQVGIMGASTSTLKVHWTRVIHIPSPPLSSNEWVGIGPLPQCLHNILSLQKIYSADGEAYWLSCFTGLSLETNPTLGGNVRVDERKTKEMLYEYYNRLSQRTLLLKGMHANQLAPNVVSPRDHVDVHIEAICIKEEMPKRVFMGSEQGELASSQDDRSFERRKRRYRRTHINAHIIIPFVDRLIAVGVLSEPTAEDGWKLDWRDLDKLTPQEQAQVALTIMQALAAYVNGGVEDYVPAQEALTRIIGWTDEEAKAVLEAAQKQFESESEDDHQPSALLQLPAGVTALLSMFQSHAQGALTEDMLSEMLQLVFQLSEKEAEELIADGLPEPEPPPELPPGAPGAPPPQPGKPGVPGQPAAAKPGQAQQVATAARPSTQVPPKPKVVGNKKAKPKSKPKVTTNRKR